MPFPPDLQIAQAASLKPLGDVAAAMGIGTHLLEAYGEHVAKIKLSAIDELADRPKAKYVVVSAVTPTPLGEGKTTTTVGLGQALCGIGRQATVAIRQPSMGPTFGIKGGAAGGGYSQVVPMDVLNLHLTGDFHAVTAAHNLLSAVLDNHLYQGNPSGIDPHDITWRRVLDVNDRALRNVIVGLGSKMDGIPRQTGFDITAASEVMAIFALARSLQEMRERFGRIVVGYTKDRTPVTAEDIGGAGAMTVIMRDALEAQPHADAGEHAGPRARRPVRQHRPRELLGGGRPHRHPRRRLPRHRGRVRGRHGRGAVLQHQVPGVGPHARRRGGRRDRAGAQGALGTSTRSSPAGRCRRRCWPRTRTRSTSAGRTCASRSRTSGCTGCRRSSRSTRSPATTPREQAAIAEIAEEMGARVAVCTHFADGGRGARELAEAVAEAADEPLGLPLPLPGLRDAQGEDRDDRDEGLRRRRGGLRPHRVAPARDLRGERLRQPPGLHRQDPPVAVVRRVAQGGADGLAPAGPGGAGLGRCRVHLPDLRRHAHHARPRRHPGRAPGRHRRGTATSSTCPDRQAERAADAVADRAPERARRRQRPRRRGARPPRCRGAARCRPRRSCG